MSANPHHIEITRAEGGAYRLRASLLLKHEMSEVFDFFSRAENLQTITPPWVGFSIITPTPIAMAVDTIIEYRIKLHGLPMKWQTLITQWDPPRAFVDEQLRGPYRQWTHRHRFTAAPDGTLAEDEVIYRVPGGPLVHALLVKRDVRRIFEYRQRRLMEIFPDPAVVVSPT